MYQSQSISGYNTSAPADDGSATEANKVKWSTIKSKLGDPVKTLAEAINTANVNAWADLASQATDDGGKGFHLVSHMLTAAEVTASVVPTNYEYKDGNLLRYGDNTTPGTTNFTTAWNNWESVASGSKIIPAGTYLVSGVTKVYHNDTFVNTENNNHAAGYQALEVCATGENNTAFGGKALKVCEGALPLGSNNVAVGFEAMQATTAGYRCVAVGYQALYSQVGALVYGNSNVAIGYQSSYNTTEGKDNTSVGYLALFTNVGGGGNSAYGYRALYSNIGTTDGDPTYAAVDGSFNTSVGYESSFSNTTGNSNAVIGWRAFYTNTTGLRNTAAGQEALYTNATGDNNTAVGYHALYTNDADSNTAVGYTALNANTSGTLNTGIGRDALLANTTGSSNTSVGYDSLSTQSTGSLCTAVGRGALKVATNNSNTGLGYLAGSTATSGTNNTFLGANAQPSAVGVSNEITLGDSSIATLRCQVTTITALSDKRDKSNIQDLTEGLDFINAMRPVSFDWDRRDGTAQGVSEYGFIAQDLLDLEESRGVKDYTRIVLEENPDKLEAAPMRTYPILIKAVQELSAKVKLLEAQLNG